MTETDDRYERRPDLTVPDEELAGSDIPEPVPERDVTDPDVAAERGRQEELATEESDALVTDELLPEERLTEFEAPEEPSSPTAAGYTGADERTDEAIEERLAQEECGGQSTTQ